MREGNRFGESTTINSDPIKEMMASDSDYAVLNGGQLELCQPCGLLGGVEDEESEEINPIKAVRDAGLPSLAEIAEHNLTH